LKSELDDYRRRIIRGETEIIVAAGRTYTGQLWVLNGSSHEIESNHIFSTEGLLIWIFSQKILMKKRLRE